MCTVLHGAHPPSLPLLPYRGARNAGSDLDRRATAGLGMTFSAMYQSLSQEKEGEKESLETKRPVPQVNHSKTCVFSSPPRPKEGGHLDPAAEEGTCIHNCSTAHPARSHTQEINWFAFDMYPYLRPLEQSSIYCVIHPPACGPGHSTQHAGQPSQPSPSAGAIRVFPCCC